MPAKGTTKLTTRKKAKIVAEKRLGIMPVSEIAVKNNVHEQTVYRVDREATPEVEKLAETYQQRIIKQAKLNVEDGLKVINERISLDKTPLKDITGAVKLSHDIVQVQTGQPTDITKHTSPVVFAIQIVKNIKVERPEITNGEIVELIDSGVIDVPEVDAETWGEVRGLLADGK